MRSGVPGNRPPGVGSRGNDAEVSGKLVPFCAPFNMALAAVEALYRRPTLRLDCHASMGDENSSDRPKAGTWHAMYELWMGTFTTGRTSTKDALTGQSWFGIFPERKPMASCRILQPRAPSSVRVLPERMAGAFYESFWRKWCFITRRPLAS